MITRTNYKLKTALIIKSNSNFIGLNIFFFKSTRLHLCKCTFVNTKNVQQIWYAKWPL